MEADQRMVDKVRKLLARARDQEGTPEGATAARLARKVMYEHAIAESDVEAAERRGSIEEREYNATDWPEWRKALLAECGIHAGCVDGLDEENGFVYLFGPRTCLDLADYLFEVISRGLETEAEKKHEETRKYVNWYGFSTIQVERSMDSWYRSAVAALRQRLDQMRREDSKVDPSTTELVHVQLQDVHAWLQKEGIQLPEESPIVEDDFYRFSRDGWLAGQRVPIQEGLASSGEDGKKLRG